MERLNAVTRGFIRDDSVEPLFCHFERSEECAHAEALLDPSLALRMTDKKGVHLTFHPTALRWYDVSE
jgi:hypothetical protein